MKNRKKLALAGLLIIVLSILMVSCGSRPTPEPTVDVNVLATNAAQTIEARFTETALAKPTDTPQPTYTRFLILLQRVPHRSRYLRPEQVAASLSRQSHNSLPQSSICRRLLYPRSEIKPFGLIKA